MGDLSREVRNVQNPALGALLLWRFSVGYSKASRVHDAPPIPLAYIILPIVLHQETHSLLSSTQKRSGLRAFVGKFSESKHSKSDLLLSIHNRALALRELTTRSLELAVSTHLVHLDTTEGVFVPVSKTAPKVGIPKEIQTMAADSEKLGLWCAELSLFEISLALRVRF